MINIPHVWTPDIENVLNDIRINAYNMSEVHRKQFLQLKNFSNYFDIPVIVISAVNTIISVGVQAFLPQPTISITNCILSATCGIIVSVKLYLAIQTQMELELTTSKDFYSLSVEIYKTISLNISNRGVDGVVFLNDSFQTYSELVQKSSVLRKKINDKMVPHKLGMFDSIYSIPNSLANDVMRVSNLHQMSAEMNSMTNSISDEILNDCASHALDESELINDDLSIQNV